MTNKKGFTLVETLVAMGIIFILIGLGMFFSFGFYQSYLLETEKNIVASLLRKARGQSLANLGQTKHGVYLDFAGGRYIVFEGNDYASRNQDLDEVIFQGSKTVQLSGAAEIVFETLTGSLTENKEITIADSRQAITVVINQQGGINY